MSNPPNAAVRLCSRAFELVEHRGFESFDDGSDEAERAQLFYEPARRTVLEALDWNFARVYVNPSLVSGVAAPVDRPHPFTLPSGCLRVRQIDDPKGVRWERAGDYLMAACEGPLLVSYTADINNPQKFSAGFTTALELLLAHYFAPKFSRSQNRAEILFDRFERALDAAAFAEAREQSDPDAYGHDQGMDVADRIAAPAGLGAADWFT